MKLLIYLIYCTAVSGLMAARGIWNSSRSPVKPSGRAIKRVLIVGATGGTGLELVKQALERGYQVTAFVRNPAKLTIEHPQLTIVRGDIMDQAAVDDAVAGQDAVVSALGHRRLFVPSKVQTEGTRHVLRAMEKHDVRRFVCVTSLGLGDSVGRMGVLSTFLVLPFILVIYFWDKSKQEQLIGASDREWIVVRPGVLTNGPKRGQYRHGLGEGSYFGMTRSSRADVADFMLRQLQDDHYVQRAVAMAG
jgi:putative NADH-flavin reductase